MITKLQTVNMLPELKQMKKFLICSQCQRKNAQQFMFCGHFSCNKCYFSSPNCEHDGFAWNRDDRWMQCLTEKTLNLLSSVGTVIESTDEEITQELKEPLAKIVRSVETQCDLKASTNSVATQTETINDQQHQDCCIHRNLKKIIDLNICESLNAILNGILSSGNVENLPKPKEREEEMPKNISASKDMVEEPAKMEIVIQNKCENTGMTDSDAIVDVKTKKIDERIAWIEESQPQNQDETLKVLTSKVDKSSDKMPVITAKTRPKRSRQILHISEKNSVDSNEPQVKTESSRNNSESFQESTTEPESSSIKRPKRSTRSASIRSKTATESKETSSKDDTEKVNIKKATKKQKLVVEKKKNVKNSKQNPEPDETTEKIQTESISSKNLSEKRSSRNTSMEKPKNVILCSGLDPIQRRKLEKASIALDFEFVNQWSPNVTHLVVNLAKDIDKSLKLTPRSIKYLLALLGNKWIVSFDWIITSVQSGRLVEEEKYEIRGVKNCLEQDCPKRSRLNKIAFFQNYAIHFVGQFKNFHAQVHDLQLLVSTGKGVPVEKEEDFKNIDSNLRRIYVTESVGLMETQDSTKFVSFNTFLDAITNLKRL